MSETRCKKNELWEKGIAVLKDYDQNCHNNAKCTYKNIKWTWMKPLKQQGLFWQSFAQLWPEQSTQDLLYHTRTENKAFLPESSSNETMLHEYSLEKKKSAFESVPLSWQSIISRGRETAGILELHLKNKAEITTFSSFLSLEECCDVTYKAQSPLSCTWNRRF